MLITRRKRGEQIRLTVEGTEVLITVIAIRRDVGFAPQVSLAIDAPQSVKIDTGAHNDRIMKQH